MPCQNILFVLRSAFQSIINSGPDTPECVLLVCPEGVKTGGEGGVSERSWDLNNLEWPRKTNRQGDEGCVVYREVLFGVWRLSC